MPEEGRNTNRLKERRIFDRVVARLPIKFSREDEIFSTDVYLRDISAGGAKLVSRRRFPLEENVNLWVQIPDGRDPLHLRGKVVWARETELNLWDTGISFPKINFMDLHRVFSL